MALVRLAAFAAAVLLTGCSFFQKDDPRLCPRVSILNEAASVAVYRAGPGRDLIDVVHEGRLGDITWSCKYSEKEVSILTRISFLAQRGPASQDRKAEFQYFVAVRDHNQDILAKQIFATVIEFPEGRAQAGVFEEIEQVIPLPDETSGPEFEIIVGFQLTEEQLERNRERRRF